MDGQPATEILGRHQQHARYTSRSSDDAEQPCVAHSMVAPQDHPRAEAKYTNSSTPEMDKARRIRRGSVKTAGRQQIAPMPLRRAQHSLTQDDLERYANEHPHMKREEMIDLDRLFVSWDEDGSGEISVDEMAVMLARVVRDLFDQVDTDHSGQLDDKEIKELVILLGQNLSTSEFRAAMREMDPDGSGGVTFDEFNRWWKGQEGDEAASKEELQDLFAEVDTDGSGEIDVHEFIACIATKMETHMPAAVDGANEDHGAVQTRQAMQMVRTALMSVRDDVHAIYGMSHRPKSSLQHAQEVENSVRNRRCFWTTENVGRPWCVRFRKFWDVLQVLVLGYISITVPFRSGFGIEVEPGGGVFWLEVWIDIYFIFDIFLNLRTAYRTPEGDFIVNPKEIRRNYLRSWFAIDAAACFPLTYIELIFSSDDGFGGKLKSLKIFRLLRMAKMLRLAKVQRVLKRVDEAYPGIWTVSKLASLIVIILYISHVFACMWYFAGSDAMTVGEDGGKRVGEVVHGWVHRNGYHPELDEWNTYWDPWLDAYYYAITTLTTVGYGDRTAYTNREKIFSIVTELAGGIIFGMLAGTLSSMVTEGNASQAKADEQLEALKTFMIQKRVNKQMRRDVVDQMEYYYKTRSVIEEEEVLDRLPPKFRKTLLLQMYKPQLMTCPLFAGLDEAIITQLAIILKPYLAVQGDNIITEGEVGEEMYMVVKGDVRLESQEYEKFGGKSWGDGAFFGELPLLGMGNGPLRNKHVYSVLAHTESDLTFLKREQMETMELDHPVFKAQVRRLAAKRAMRFGVEVTRITIAEPATTRRRMSVAVDTEQLAADGVHHGADAEFAKSKDFSNMGSAEAAAAASAMFAGAEESGADTDEDDNDSEAGSEDGGGASSRAGKGRTRPRQELGSIAKQLEEIEAFVSLKLPKLETNIKGLESQMSREISAVLQALKSMQLTNGAHRAQGAVSAGEHAAMGSQQDSQGFEEEGEKEDIVEEDPNDLAVWLAALGASELEESFRDHGFETVEDVARCQMSESDLKELGISKLKMRKEVFMAIAERQELLGISVMLPVPSPNNGARASSPPSYYPSTVAPGSGGPAPRPHTADEVAGRNVSPTRGASYWSGTSRGTPTGSDSAGGLTNAEITQYKQLAVRAERQINARRQLNQLEHEYGRGGNGASCIDLGLGGQEPTPDQRRKQRSMFGRRTGVGPRSSSPVKRQGRTLGP